MSEKISQFVDGELPQTELARLIGETAQDRLMTKRWRNYHLIGNLMRGEGAVGQHDLGARIARELEQTPTVLAPQPLPGGQRQEAYDVWRPAAMFALAASVLLAAVIIMLPEAPPSRPSAQVAQIAPADADLLAQELDEMLAGHGEFTASPGLNGLVAYAKLVSSQNIRQ